MVKSNAKKRNYLLGIGLGLLSVSIPVYAQIAKNNTTVLQTSAITPLLNGIYDGDLTFKELAKHGNLGLGTFNGLDGEMVAVDGEFYQIKADGIPRLVTEDMKTPFATVTSFEKELSIAVDSLMTYEEMQKYLDSQLPDKNTPAAIRIDGKFKYLKVRSIDKQEKPYPSLAEVTKQQVIFDLKDIEGTLVGFRFPSYMAGVNVNGYHLHFISKDKTAGGHLLDGSIDNVMVKIDYTPDVSIVLPTTQEFQKADFDDGDASEIINKVE